MRLAKTLMCSLYHIKVKSLMISFNLRWNLLKIKTAILDSFEIGQSVKIGINLRGREWVNPQGETKYFNSIQGWRIENLTPTSSTSEEIPPVAPLNAFEPATDLSEDEPDDLPF